MANYRVQMGFPLESALPKDVVTINPHYFGDDPQGLVDRLKANLIASVLVGAATPFTIKCYDAEKPPPSYPLAIATNGTGFKVTTQPHELAMCLSYYSTWNRPGYRGRLYIPVTFIAGGAVNLRPSGTQITNTLAWGTILTSGLPAGHNWILWSRKQQKGFGVTNTWVDDEWDVMRSRGLRGSTRQLATVP